MSKRDWTSRLTQPWVRDLSNITGTDILIPLLTILLIGICLIQLALAFMEADPFESGNLSQEKSPVTVSAFAF